MKSVFILVVLGIFAVNTAYGLKCYQCMNCEDLKSETKSTDCKEDSLWLPGTTTPAPGTTTPASTTTEKKPEEPEEPEEPEKPGKPADEKIENAFQHKFARANSKADEFQCFVQKVKYGEGTILNRGCTKRDKECTGDDCSVCKEDDCNFGMNIKSWALSSLVLIAVIKMFI